MVVRGWGKGNRELGFNENRVSVCQDEKFCERMAVMVTQQYEHINATELYTSKWLRWQFLYYIDLIIIKQWEKDIFLKRLTSLGGLFNTFKL